MSLVPAFTLSANQGHDDGYDPESPDAPSLWGYQHAYGMVAGWYGISTVAGQAENDVIILGRCSADDADENDITDWEEEVRRRSVIHITVGGRNLRDDHQYLLTFGFKKHWGYAAATIQFFVGTEWVSSEAINDDTETIALLLDGLGGGAVQVIARLAAPEGFGGFVQFTGLQGYIL